MKTENVGTLVTQAEKVPQFYLYMNLEKGQFNMVEIHEKTPEEFFETYNGQIDLIVTHEDPDIEKIVNKNMKPYMGMRFVTDYATVEDIADFINYALPYGGTVCDPAAGSGIVAIAAMRCGVGFVGAENSTENIAKIRNAVRLKNERR